MAQSKEHPPVITEERRDALLKQFEAIDNDPEVAERAEKFAREVGYISPEELLRQFTI